MTKDIAYYKQFCSNYKECFNCGSKAGICSWKIESKTCEANSNLNSKQQNIGYWYKYMNKFIALFYKSLT